MLISTSYFAKLKLITVPVTICGKAPEWYAGYQYKKLAPKYSTFIKYKSNYNWDEYVTEYYDLVLNKLDPNQVINELSKFGSDITLICYEAPKDNCHRHLVSQWFKDTLNINCKELIF